MSALLRSPLLHFFVLGALFFALRNDPGDALERGAPRRIEISRERLDERIADVAKRRGRAPEGAEVDRLIEAEIEEEILFREALAQGLLERDPGVKSRLLQKMRFLEGAGSVEDVPALLARAVALDLHQEDVVVRRILVQKMRSLGSRLDAGDVVSDSDVARAYAERNRTLREPERRTLRHVFLGRDRRGDRLPADAERVGRRLASESIAPEDALSLGDSFPSGHRLAERTQVDLARAFGPDFARASFAATPDAWAGPIESAYGLHFVRVEAIVPGAVPPLPAVASRLRLALEEERRAAKLEALLTELRGRYRVVIETSAPAPETASAESQETG